MVYAGVLALNLCFLATGYAVLLTVLRRVPLRRWGSYAGVALLCGAGLTVTVLSCIVVLGGRSNVTTFLVVCVGLAALGGLVSRLTGGSDPPDAGPPASSVAAATLQYAAGVVVVVAAAAIVYGAFTSDAWLDDTWDFWLPKGVVLDHVGLDRHIFVPSLDYVSVNHANYPVGWSIAIGLSQAFARQISVSAITGQIAILFVAFLAAAVRLLWPYVRPTLLWLAVLFLLASPALYAGLTSGGADVPVAVFIAIAVIGLLIWLARGDLLGLLTAFAGTAGAAEMKLEGALETALLAVVVLLIGLFAGLRRRVVAGGIAILAGLLTYVPWYAWTGANGVKDRTADPAHSIDPRFLFDQRDRILPAADRFLHVLFLENRQWFLLVPLVLLLAAAAAAIRRRTILLTPFAIVGATFGFWVWVFWADTDDLATRLGAAGRVITPLMLLAAFGCAVLGQELAEVAPRRVASLLGLEIERGDRGPRAAER